MAVVIAMLRGVNVGGYQKIQMEALRTLCGSLGLRDAQTYIQSGNVVFREDSEEPVTLARRLEDGIEHSFGFRPGVMVRTPSELRNVIAKNPFADRPEIDPSRLLVSFMASAPAQPVTKSLRCHAIPKNCESMDASFTFIIPTEWLARKSRWPASRRRCNDRRPAETGTRSSS
jgi:uncharacterized protein (DUF1697 family)